MKFDFKELISMQQSAEIESGFIKTSDNGWLISDEHFKIGETELYK